ncbi:MAG: S8 family serine peptidase [Actinobacteria bacterium]|nr:S8 family serine peptidase [Actinomycetota bacterium]
MHQTHNGTRASAVWGARGWLWIATVSLCAAVAAIAGAFAGVSTAATPEVRLVKGSYVPGEVLVRFREGASASAMAAAHASAGATVLRSFTSVSDLQLVRLSGMSVGEALAKYRQRSDVLYAEPNQIYRIDDVELTPNDPFYPSMYNLNNTGQTGGTPDADIDAPEAWNVTTGSNAVYVGVLDTGVDWDHPDLINNTKPNPAECNGQAGQDDDSNGYVDDCHGIDPLNGDTNPMDDNGHGTHTSGTIGAIGNNNTGVTGINWNVQIIACKTHDPSGNGDAAALVECLQYMEIMKAQGKNVVATNNSYGGCPEACGFSQALEDAIASNMDEGILFVASAGNDAANNDTTLKYPADYFVPNVIAVAATDDDDLLASFSNFGTNTVSVGAPGVLVRSTVWNNSYTYFSGTSMAGPHVAGIAGLLAAQDPTRTWSDIRNLILAGGDPKASLTNKTITGRRVNANGSLTCARQKVFGPLRPLPAVDGQDPITVAALNINCARAARAPTVTITPGNTVIQLKDDGRGADLARRDGIFSGRWNLSPCDPGTYTLTYSNGKQDITTVTC